MNIRKASTKDIPRIKELLQQVLEIHANIRPDIFIPGTAKYTEKELEIMDLYESDNVTFTAQMRN